MNAAVLERISDVEALVRYAQVATNLDTADKSALLRRASVLLPEASQSELLSRLGISGAKPEDATACSRLALSYGLLALDGALPPPRDFVIQDLILAGKSVLLGGLGGSSKTLIALQAAVCVVLGLPFMGKAAKACSAVVLLGEEDAQEIARRVGAIAAAMRLTDEQLALVRERLRVFPMVGLDMRITAPRNGVLEATDMVQEVIGAANALGGEAGLPVGLIVLDHLGLLHGGDFNAREDAVQTMRLINHITQETGAAVVVVAHSPKNSVGKEGVDAADIAGSAGFVDQSRGAFVVRAMDQETAKKFAISDDERKAYTSLTNVKANYTASGGVLWMRRCTVEGYEAGFLRYVELQPPVKEFVSAGNKVRSAIIALVKERSLSRDALLGFAAAKGGRIPVSKDRARSELDAMIADGELTYRDPTDDERRRLRIKGKTSGFLVVAN